MAIAPRRIGSRALEGFCRNAFQKVGMTSFHSGLAAKPIVAANLRGVDSHGVALLPAYIERFRKGEIAVDAKLTVEKSEGGAMLLNGHNSFGHIIAIWAMERAIKKASEFGCSWIGVYGSNHFGMTAYYAMQAVAHDMIGIVMTVSNINTMAPWGGLDVLLGNNPLAIAVPAHRAHPVVFDAAFSVAARRKIHQAYAANEPIPEGWALTKDGQPTTDPKEALAGILVPAGGYKGYGLAFMISLLAGALTGGTFGKSVSNTNVGHLFGAIKIASFTDPQSMKRTVDRAVGEMKKSRPTSGETPIRVPGERAGSTEKERKKNGIPLAEKTKEALRRLANDLGIRNVFG